MGRLPHTITEEDPSGYERFSTVHTTVQELLGLDAGCLRLMQEIVIRAVQDLFEETKHKTNSLNQQYTLGTARFWLFDDESEEPYSFRWICEILGVDRDRFVAQIKTRTIKNSKGQTFHYVSLPLQTARGKQNDTESIRQTS